MLHVHHNPTGQTVNTQGSAYHGIRVNASGWLVFHIRERAGVDLNADGDTDDVVPHTYHLATPNSTSNLGLATDTSTVPSTVHISRDWVVFEVSEKHQGVDLNGDGDTLDHIAHLHNLSTGVTRNLGGAHPLLSEDHLEYLVFESFVDGDLNGDGDSADSVLHTLELPGSEPRNLGLPAQWVETSGEWLWFAVSESAQGTDLNADSDTADIVLHAHHRGTQRTRNLELALPESLRVFRNHRPEIVGDTLLLEVPEEDQGEDLNGDGDLADLVAHVSDLRTGESRNLGFAGVSFLFGGGLGPPWPATAVTENRIVFGVDEEANGDDLNGDGDSEDRLLYIFDPETGQVSAVGFSFRSFDLSLVFGFWDPFSSGSRVALPVAESLMQTDLNGDGDESDLVLHVLDVERNEMLNLGVDFGVDTCIQLFLCPNHEKPAFGYSDPWLVMSNFVYDTRNRTMTRLDVRADLISLSGDWLLIQEFNPSINRLVDLTRLGELSTAFLRGDCNDDHTVDISDAVFSLGSLFLGDGDPGCDDACDSNDDGTVDISDAINTLGVLFLGNGTIPLPGMEQCGVDPTDDEVGCASFRACP